MDSPQHLGNELLDVSPHHVLCMLHACACACACCMHSLFVNNELLDAEPLLLALVRHGGGLLAWDGMQLQAPYEHLREHSKSTCHPCSGCQHHIGCVTQKLAAVPTEMEASWELLMQVQVC